ncbi:hypothetical protein [Thalassomonas actiniarum]|uniref:Uncharacterized protein n=1 Tax=Thalassomonas actiniarum TaxID=485447 RepID=A0AAE9YZ06_9GAMM|nr:hypothetical protein [Thalassomonas actiniarum]WDE02222.1 hypothetical protein SG35_031185 [Thalassomonas actiniarum]
MPYITDRLFSNLDTNIKDQTKVEDATSYGVFDDLSKTALLTSNDIYSHLDGHQPGGTAGYTLDDYLTHIWSKTANESNFDDVDTNKTHFGGNKDDYWIEVATKAFSLSKGPYWDYDNQYHMLEDYNRRIANSGAKLSETITANNKVDSFASAQALLDRSGINTEAEAEQLVANIFKIYEENNLKYNDGKSHVFEVDRKLASDKAYIEDGSSGGLFSSEKYEGYDKGTINVDVKFTLDYDKILKVALAKANNTAIPTDAQMSDSIFQYLHGKYSSDAGITIREDYTAGKLHRNLIPEAFTNTYAMEEAAADAKAMTGLDLETMEKNYNKNHPGNELYLTPGMWNGSNPSYEVVLEQAKGYQKAFRDLKPAPNVVIDVGTTLWQEFQTWEKNLDPERKFIKEGSYWRNVGADSALHTLEFDSIDKALEDLITTIEDYQAAKYYQHKFAEYAEDKSLLETTYPTTRKLDASFWQGFLQWANQVDPGKQYIKQDSFDRNNATDSILSDAEFKSIGEALDAIVGPLKEPLYPLKVEQDRYLTKDRFMQSHRFYLGGKERQYQDTADQLRDLNKMMDEARHWQEWISKYEREEDDFNLAEENLKKYNEFYAWIVHSDVAYSKDNDYKSYIDWKGEYGNNPDMSEENLKLLNTEITNYIQSLENRSNLVTVDANQHLTRYNESLEFLSAVLKRIMTTLDNVLSNVKG